MRRRAVLAVLTAALVWNGVHSAENDVYQMPKPAKKTSWWWPWGGGEKEPEKKPAAKPKKAEPAESPRITPKTAEVPPPASAGPRGDPEYKNFLRRQAACFRLQEIADETGDASLRLHAQTLEARAFEIYHQRTGLAGHSSISRAEEQAMIQKLMEETRNAQRGAAVAGRNRPTEHRVESPIRTAPVPPLPGERKD